MDDFMLRDEWQNGFRMAADDSNDGAVCTLFIAT